MLTESTMYPRAHLDNMARRAVKNAGSIYGRKRFVGWYVRVNNHGAVSLVVDFSYAGQDGEKYYDQTNVAL